MAASALLQRKRDDAYLGTCVDEVSDLGDAVGDAVGNAVGDVEKTPRCEADYTDSLYSEWPGRFPQRHRAGVTGERGIRSGRGAHYRYMTRCRTDLLICPYC